MEAEQKKKIEEQLRKLIAQAEELPEEKQTPRKNPGNVRVIRRRHGEPDLLIA